MKYKHVFSICVYESSPYLERCIRSLKAQSLPGHMILCTSTPGPYIDGLARKYGVPLYIRDGESNIRDGWNFAYEMADGELVTIAHQDGMYHREYSVQLLEAYGRYPDMTMFITDYVITENGRPITGDKMFWVKRLLCIPLHTPCLNGLARVRHLSLILGNPICCPATTYQKKMLSVPLVCSGFQFTPDWDNLYKLAGERGRFICVERPLLYYRIHEGTTTKACTADSRRQLEEEIMFRRFWPEPVARLLMHLCKSAYAEYEQRIRFRKPKEQKD